MKNPERYIKVLKQRHNEIYMQLYYRSLIIITNNYHKTKDVDSATKNLSELLVMEVPDKGKMPNDVFTKDFEYSLLKLIMMLTEYEKYIDEYKRVKTLLCEVFARITLNKQS